MTPPNRLPRDYKGRKSSTESKHFPMRGNPVSPMTLIAPKDTEKIKVVQVLMTTHAQEPYFKALGEANRRGEYYYKFLVLQSSRIPETKNTTDGCHV